MDITPKPSAQTQIVEGYGAGGFKISSITYPHAVLVMPEHTLPWQMENFNSLTIESLQPLIEAKPEILIIGSGTSMGLLAPAIRNALRAQFIAVDVMDTGAACRTYNVLVTDGRLVAAALLPI